MVADQRRKSLNGAVEDIILRDKSRGKKKKQEVGLLESNGSGVKPHVSLEWEPKRRRVIAKREQIGLSWRNLRSFAEPSPRRHKILADAFDVPTGLFKLENFEDVLSYEVWQTCLSEKERRFLAQFLPRETEPQQAVKQLLAGENFHFGNPFLDWAASLRAGNLHPDAVVHLEQCLRAEKSTYYLELHRYHNEMIGSLLKMKERWQCSSDLEKEFKQKTLRSRKGKEKKFLYADRSEFPDPDNSFAGTSKSSSLREEKTSNSDEQIESFKKAEESRRRTSKKRPIKDRSGNLPVASDNFLVDEGKSRKGVKLKKRNIVYDDGTKYMSYVKISKKQHKLAKSMEQSDSSIQPRSLGYLSNLQIQPYEVFVDEQRKKLHDHWLRLANHDLPSAYRIWNDIHSQRQQMMRSLEQELLDRHNSLMKDDVKEIPVSEPPAQKGDEGMEERLTVDEDKESPPCSSQDQQDNIGTDDASSMEDDEESMIPDFVNNQRGDDVEVDRQFIAKNHDESLPCPLQDVKLAAGLMQDSPARIMHSDDANSVPCSSQDQFLDQEPSTNCDPNFSHVSHVGPEPEILKISSTAQDVSAYSGNLSGGDLIDIDRVPFSQGNEMWQPASSVSSMPLTYFDSSSVGCQFNSAAEIPLPSSLPPMDGEHRTPQWIDLGSNLHGQQLLRDSNSFISYPNNQDQNELLQSIFNDQQGLLHPVNTNNQQKNLGLLNYQLSESVPTETYGQRMQNCIQPNMTAGSMLPSSRGSRFMMQQRQQEQLLQTSVSIQDWAIHAPSTIPPSSLSGSNWFSNSNEHQVRGGGWNSCSGGPSLTNNLGVDQSVYGVLPHCNQPSPRPQSHDSVEQSIPSGNYRHGLMNGIGISNVLPHHTAPLLDYTNRRDDDTRWMSLPLHQNSSMNDSMGKPPFLGSWDP